MLEIRRKCIFFLILLLSMKAHGQTTTGAPTPAASTTAAPTPAASTTAAPTPAASTTAAPTSAASSTAAPTPASSTTGAPNTATPVNCKDAPSCTGLPTTVCEFPSMVVACPVLCHAKTSCSATGGTIVRSSFRLINEVYNNDLANPSSTAFIALKTKVESEVGAALLQELGSRFVSIIVNGFTSGSVIVNADVTITEEKNSDDFETVSKAVKNSGVTGLDSSSVKVGVCSEGYVNVNNQCLMFGNQRLTWSASGTACSSLKGRLVVPTDFQKMATYIITNNLFYWQYWVGASATDQSNPGTYTWLDGSTVDSSLWYPGYPLTPGTSGITAGQSCVKLHPNSNTNNGLIAAWDSNCNGANTYRYICEEL